VGIRETLNENPKMTAGGVVGVVIVSVAVAWALWPDRGDVTASGELPAQTFFSIDDGKNWFADDIKKVPPFEKDGKPALRALVFQCTADGKPFVSCLVRYMPQTQQTLEAIYARPPEQQNPMEIRQVELDGMEVKAPGQATWLKRSDPRATALIMPRCPDGSEAQPVSP
jgi:hypothetical protein